jgi:hypothetical protein
MKSIAWRFLLGLAAALALAIAAGCTSASNNATKCASTTQCGGNLSECVTNDANGVCIAKSYTVGGQSFDCHSCIDCAAAETQAAQVCAGVPADDGGTSSGGTSSGGTSSGGTSSSGGDGGTGVCSAKTPCGTSGVTYQECTKLAANGTCESIDYVTSDGHTFTCPGCTSCSSAAAQLAQYCANPGGTPTTTCSAAIACGSGGLTYEQCTTSNAGACKSIEYRVSNGAVYTCASCSSCSAADQQLTSYCANQGTPTTSCSSSTTCGSNGLTYTQCTTYSAGGTCESSTYEVSNGTAYTCASCSNCTSAYDSVQSYCSSQVSPTTSCSTSYACGSTGATYYTCTTSTGSTCDSITYETSTGNSWQCATCSDCTSAYDNMTNYCASLNGASCGTTTCGSTATCCDCSGTYECISIPAGYTCASYGCTG